jgi:hypothetical protein
MIAAALHVHGSGSGLFASLARGFAWSVGWMVARGLGLPVALAVLVVGGGLWWLLSRRSSRRERISK